MKTSYDFMEYFINNLSPKYFPNISLDDHRIGTWGYTNEVFGTLSDSITMTAINQANNLLLISADREHLLKGSFGSGDTYNLFATPANQQYLIGIPKDLVITADNKDDAEISYILPDFSIDYDGLIYTLDNSIEITAINNFDETFNYSSKLLDASNVINPHLFTIKDMIADSEFILIRVNMKQISKLVYKKPILENSITLKNMEFPYTDQVSGISVTYKVPGGEVEVLEVHNKYGIISTTEKYVSYFIDEEASIIRIELDTFDPIYNSELTVTIDTTKGTLGNFTNTYPIISVVDNDFLYATPASDSKDGKDVIETEDLRSQIMLNKATLKSIDTTKDLDLEFVRTNTNESIANVFKKKRDDLLTMEYSSFALLRDIQQKYPIPTNTLNIKLADGEEDLYHVTSKRKIFLPGTKLSLKSGELRLLEKNITDVTDQEIETAELDNSKLLFGLPFLTVISESPDIVGYYLNSVNQEITSDVEYDNSMVDYQFILNRIKVSRNAISTDKYHIDANVIWNSNLPAGLLVDDVLTDTSKLIGVVYIYDIENNVIAHKIMTLDSYNADNNYFSFSIDIQTDDYINENDELRVKDMKQPGVDIVSDIMIMGSSCKVGVAIYVEDVTNSKGLYDAIVPNMDGYSISNVYAFTDTNFFLSLNNINTGITLTNEDAVDYLNLTDVPVVRYSYLKDNILDIANMTSSLFDTLYTINKSINEDIDMKFFNTYGTSRYIKSDDIVVGNTNTDFTVKITFNDFVTDTYKEKIKQTISDLIDTDGGVIVSNLFAKLKEDYVFESIELVSITGVANVYKDTTPDDLNFDTASSTEIREYVPEKYVINPDRITIQSVVKQ